MMKLIFIVCLVLLGLHGCNGNDSQIVSSAKKTFGDALHSGSAVIAPIASTSQADKHQFRINGIVQVPEPDVADVVVLPSSAGRSLPVGNIQSPKGFDASSGEAFEVVRANARTMKNLDNYFSPPVDEGESK